MGVNARPQGRGTMDNERGVPEITGRNTSDSMSNPSQAKSTQSPCHGIPWYTLANHGPHERPLKGGAVKGIPPLWGGIPSKEPTRTTAIFTCLCFLRVSALIQALTL